MRAKTRRITQTQGLRPGHGSVEADSECAPLDGIAEQGRRVGRTQGDHRRGRKVGGEIARAAAVAPKAPERERREDRGELTAKLAKGGRFGGSKNPVDLPAQGLAQGAHPQREEQARNADDEECDLPASQAERRGCVCPQDVPAIDDGATQKDAHASADVDPACINGEDSRAHPLREVIGEHRERRGTRARLAHAHADARRSQL